VEKPEVNHTFDGFMGSRFAAGPRGLTLSRALPRAKSREQSREQKMMINKNLCNLCLWNQRNLWPRTKVYSLWPLCSLWLWNQRNLWLRTKVYSLWPLCPLWQNENKTGINAAKKNSQLQNSVNLCLKINSAAKKPKKAGKTIAE
jgi:hypothetical protein